METSVFDNKIDRNFVRKGKLKEQGNDFLFWQSQPYLKRLQTIEQIRIEFNIWQYGNEQGLQRIYTIVKRK